MMQFKLFSGLASKFALEIDWFCQSVNYNLCQALHVKKLDTN